MIRSFKHKGLEPSVIRSIDTLAETRSTQRDRRLMIENEIGTCVVDSAVQIHRETGPGLLETVYEVILAQHLRKAVFRSNDRYAFRLSAEFQ